MRPAGTAAVRLTQLTCAQAVDMLEQAGGSMDKQYLREAVANLEQQVKARRAPVRSEHFERFKFWLGLPNAYYALTEE